MKSQRSQPAFTLIELLTVIGIVTLMAGGLGLALRDGSPAVGLKAAQSAVARVVDVARGQAALQQNRVTLVVRADPVDDRFLRSISIVVETEPDSGQWRATGDETVLPKGVYLVPAAGTVSGVEFAVAGNRAAPWPPARQSSFQAAPEGSIQPEPDYPAGSYLRMVTPLTASGLAGNGGGDKLVVASARRTAGGVIFDRPEQVCGVVISAYGVTALINDGAGFDF